MLVRSATPADYATFVRLFPELRVPDPVPDAATWGRDMMPTSFVVERDGTSIGIAYYQVLDRVGFLRQIITDPTVRRSGAGRALMDVVREKCRSAGCAEWCLNVFPHNTAAVTLYETYGFARAYESKVVELGWARLDGTSACAEARVIEPADDAHVEHQTKMIAGLLGDARSKGRILRMIEDGRGGPVNAAAIFDPAFPGAYPYWAHAIDHAIALLHGLRPHRRPQDDSLRIVLADQPEIAAGLIALGGHLRMETMHMRARF
jgi:GNAT superfamily N-acetyltransferase